MPLIGKKLRNHDLKFLEFEHENETFGIRTDSSRKDFKHTQKNLHELSLVYAELGAVFNAFSLHETSNQSLSRGIEQLGQALDSAHLCTNTLISELDSEFGDDLKEFQQYSKVIEVCY